jgi:hypothetical protein
MKINATSDALAKAITTATTAFIFPMSMNDTPHVVAVNTSSVIRTIA